MKIFLVKILDHFSVFYTNSDNLDYNIIVFYQKTCEWVYLFSGVELGDGVGHIQWPIYSTVCDLVYKFYRFSSS